MPSSLVVTSVAKPARPRCAAARETLRWVAFYACCFASLYSAYWVVASRVRAGQDQQASLDALRADPAAFVWYTLELPDERARGAASPLAVDDDNEAAKRLIDRWRDAPRGAAGPTDDASDFASLFVLAYGAWTSSLDAAAAARLLRRHCGAREFGWIVTKTTDAAHCGGALPAAPAACRGGFYLDDAGRAAVCPDGAFCRRRRRRPFWGGGKSDDPLPP